MGEYVNYGKSFVKLGTCEDLYYTTYEDLKKRLPHLSKAYNNLSPKEYLDAKHGFRFRFPFFGERPQFGGHDNPDRGFLVKIPRNLLSECEDWLCHDECSHNVFPSFGFSYRFRSKCPADPERGYRVYSLSANEPDDYFIFELVQQKLVEDQLQTVVRCPFCHAKSRWRKELMEQVAAVILDPENTWTDEETEENIKIALKGYSKF